jgi:hypothetical protein
VDLRGELQPLLELLRDAPLLEDIQIDGFFHKDGATSLKVLNDAVQSRQYEKGALHLPHLRYMTLTGSLTLIYSVLCVMPSPTLATKPRLQFIRTHTEVRGWYDTYDAHERAQSQSIIDAIEMEILARWVAPVLNRPPVSWLTFTPPNVDLALSVPHGALCATIRAYSSRSGLAFELTLEASLPAGDQQSCSSYKTSLIALETHESGTLELPTPISYLQPGDRLHLVFDSIRFSDVQQHDHWPFIESLPFLGDLRILDVYDGQRMSGFVEWLQARQLHLQLKTEGSRSQLGFERLVFSREDNESLRIARAIKQSKMDVDVAWAR